MQEALPRGELTRRAQEIAARHYDIPDSKRISVSVDTLLDWALRYRTGGFEALAPKPRQYRGPSRALAPQLADLIEFLAGPLLVISCLRGNAPKWDKLQS